MDNLAPRAAAPAMPDPLLRIEGLKMHFRNPRGFLRPDGPPTLAVDDVDFDIHPGETLSLVGESGSGKTTLGRCILGIYRATAGRIRYAARDGEVDLATLGEHELKPYRRDIRMIFQDPNSSLNPRRPVIDIIGECLEIAGTTRLADRRARVAELLEQVGLKPEYMSRYPHAFSGGERQRIGIARALALDPRLVVCDESVSALDVSVQAQILNLLQDLQERLGLTYLFIAHDLAVVEHLSDRVAVMYAGRLVEIAASAELFARPRHPYTEALLASIPKPDPRLRGTTRRLRLGGEVADVRNPPPGCIFHPRCRYAEDRCRSERPALRDLGNGRRAACHFAETLELAGA